MKKLRKLNPFGKKPNKNMSKYYAEISSIYLNGRFVNTDFHSGIENTVKVKVNYNEHIKELFNKRETRPLNRDIPIIKLDHTGQLDKDEIGVTWLGHSSSVLQMGEQIILIDPVLGNYVSPLPIKSFKRFYKDIPVLPESLPYIDGVIISHNHYDHLDKKTILDINHKVGYYYVPLGVNSYLEYWGIEKKKIIVMNWWEESILKDITITCTPSRHFSGRHIFDRDASLWSSWVIKFRDKQVFYSGDSSYGNHYKDISERYGSIDIALMECGQYNKLWPHAHMTPEESVQAAIDLKSKVILPVHWGAFSLSTHEWNDPPKRMTYLCSKFGLDLIVPNIGQRIILDKIKKDESTWWK